MKTIHLKKIILAACVVISGSACQKKLLDPANTTSISDASAFDNATRITAQVNGLYATLKSVFFYGGSVTIYNELRGDEFIMNKPSTTTGQQSWLQAVNPSTTEVINTWSSGYATINAVNTFLAGLTAHQNNVSAAQYANFTGEAKFIRALSYFALVQTYAQPYALNNGTSPGVPLRLTAENSNDDNQLARSSVAAVYAQILADLNDAENNLPANYNTATLNTTRATKNAAIALKARVDLTKGDYTNVIAECTKIVSANAPFQAPASGVNNKMEANIATVFGGSYAGPEAVFSLPFVTTEPGLLASFFNIAPGNGYYYLNAAGTIADPVYSSAASTDARKNFVFTNGGQKWLNKFKVASTFSDWVPIIRYSDVLLMYAEALARSGDSANITRAAALLTAVRNRSDATYVFPPLSVASQPALISTILQERKIELLGEGFRVPDLQRLGATLPAKSGAQGSAPAIPATDNRYIWPISSAETAINKLIVQNPQ
ncbi:RagB/SusD family nutrient uptake outer membrane protein [Mucilaginibacter ximonensis]|uniref:RagB/SusD family nutrient uptake outer membrane protein n=1 Tax=Mucilaginibacter ximonensis TaxID=538021 RepID=A0ABW5Y710_9SPHI